MFKPKKTSPAIETPHSTNWHTLPLKEILEQLSSSENGLNTEEAINRLEHYGYNRLPETGKKTWWQIVLGQFTSPLIAILGLAAILSLSINEVTDALFIAAVLALNAVIGGIQEWKAEKSNDALKKLLVSHSRVLRNDELIELSSEEIVPGDIVYLESGNRIPADIRLIETHGFEADESLLTGESLPVSKKPDWIGKAETPIADQLNMIFAGSVVNRGRAKGIVVNTAISTAVGQLASDILSATSAKPPLVQRMESFTKAIGFAVLTVSAVIGIISVFLQHLNLIDVFMFTVALAVSAVPEGLPIAMTIALAVATNRMAKRGVIVRNLSAVEGLGSCTTIATDKTGTLTCNELTVKQIRLNNGDIFEVSGEGFSTEGELFHNNKPVIITEHPELTKLIRASVLCNESALYQRENEWVHQGDAVDVALLYLGHKAGFKQETLLLNHPEINRIPFEPEYQYSASFNKLDDGVLVLAKGAPERILNMCEVKHSDKALKAHMKVMNEMANNGYRVIAVAQAFHKKSEEEFSIPKEPSHLEFLGFLGMIDPLRPGVKDAIGTCHKAGIKVSMITGDHQITALSIAKDLDLAKDESETITGTELEKLSEKKLDKLVKQMRVFARVAPRQKLDIVNADIRGGDFVAVTGDGVNDAPALRAANIGVAMGKDGTDVAREAADLVISDDNFSTIVAGVEEGRAAYDNIRKVIYLLISTGAAELVMVACSIALGLPLPLLPVQLLWLNLVTNGIQDVALAFEPKEEGILQRKPRNPHEPIFNRIMIERTLIASLVMGLIAVGLFDFMLKQGASVEQSRNMVLLLMVLFENLHIGNCRSEWQSIFKLSPLKSPILIIGTLLAFNIHVLFMYSDFGQEILSISPVSFQDWVVVICLALSILPIMEVHKFFTNKFKHLYINHS